MHHSLHHEVPFQKSGLGFLTPTDSESVTVSQKYGVGPAFLILKRCTSRNPFVMICSNTVYLVVPRFRLPLEKGYCALEDFWI